MNTLPARYDLTLYQGDTFTQDFYLAVTKVVKGEVVQEPIDLSGASVVAEIRRRASADEPMATFVATVVPSEAGRVRIRLTTEAAARLVAGEAVWDLQVDSGEDRRTWVAGKVRVVADVTR